MNLVDDLKAVLEPQVQVRLAVLFGSAARGKLRRGSDLDLGLLLAEPSAAAFQTVEEALRPVWKGAIDLVDLQQAPPLLRFEISRDGVLLVEREPGLWTDVKVRAMRDWWDWAPHARRIYRSAARWLEEEVGRGAA